MQAEKLRNGHASQEENGTVPFIYFTGRGKKLVLETKTNFVVSKTHTNYAIRDVELPTGPQHPNSCAKTCFPLDGPYSHSVRHAGAFFSSPQVPQLLMSIFKRFFDNRLNRLSENQFFFLFSKIRFQLIDHIKIEKLILAPRTANRLFCFLFFNMASNYDYSKKYINIFFTVIVFSLI